MAAALRRDDEREAGTTVDHPVFDHDGPWTEAAYLELPRNDRVEVIDGMLLVGPGTSAERAAAVDAVRTAITAVLPEGLAVRGPVSLRLGPDCILVPDLIVTSAAVEADEDDEDDAEDGDEDDAEPTEDAEPAADVDADEVLDSSAALMVIEVVGREHGAVDRTFKPQLYAGCRIPYLMLIDHHGPFAIAEMIISGRYHEYARAAGDETLRLEEPFQLELDLRAATSAVTGPEQRAVG
jgi:Putative restriction endonuclease